MNPQEINQRIGLAVGYTFHHIEYHPVDGGAVFEHFWLRPGINIQDTTTDSISSGDGTSLPNYHGDLNAMHEAEKTLSFEQKDSFMERLYELTIEESKHEHTWGMTHAPAAQRAEAFLRTIGQWEDEE